MVYVQRIAYPYKELYVKVDDGDAHYVRSYHWHARVGENTYYAGRNIHIEGRSSPKIGLLHRELTKAKEGEYVDHIDLDGLNCTRDNMRLVTKSQNAHNTNRKPGATGYKGVYSNGKRFSAVITVERKRMYLGTFDTSEEAAIEYDKAAISVHGKYARVNFPHFVDSQDIA